MFVIHGSSRQNGNTEALTYDDRGHRNRTNLFA